MCIYQINNHNELELWIGLFIYQINKHNELELWRIGDNLKFVYIKTRYYTHVLVGC